MWSTTAYIFQPTSQHLLILVHTLHVTSLINLESLRAGFTALVYKVLVAFIWSIPHKHKIKFPFNYKLYLANLPHKWKLRAIL